MLRRPFPPALLVYVMATPMAWPLRFRPRQSVAALNVAGLTPTGGIRIERVGRTVAVMRECRLTQANWMKDGLIYSVVGSSPSRDYLSR